MPFSLIFLSFSKISKTSFFEFALGINIINDLVVCENLLFLIFLNFTFKLDILLSEKIKLNY